MLYMGIGEAGYGLIFECEQFFVYCACTYIESTRVVREPRATRCLRENARLFLYGSVHGDVMRRRVRSRAVIARKILCVHFDFYVHYIREFPRKILRNVNNRHVYGNIVLEMPRPRVLVYGEP